jgi:hypothetical protein
VTDVINFDLFCMHALQPPEAAFLQRHEENLLLKRHIRVPGKAAATMCCICVGPTCQRQDGGIHLSYPSSPARPIPRAELSVKTRRRTSTTAANGGRCPFLDPVALEAAG